MRKQRIIREREDGHKGKTQENRFGQETQEHTHAHKSKVRGHRKIRRSDGRM